MDSATKAPEDMSSDELRKHLERGTVAGTKPSKSGDVKAKKPAKVKGSTVVKAAKKSAAKSAPKKGDAAKARKAGKAKLAKAAKKPEKKRANLSLIDLDKLKSLVKVKGGATVPKLMKALRQPRINVSRALARLGKLVKVNAKRAPHEGKPGQRPFVYTLG